MPKPNKNKEDTEYEVTEDNEEVEESDVETDDDIDDTDNEELTDDEELSDDENKEENEDEEEFENIINDVNKNDEIYIEVKKENRKTINRLTKYELVRIIGERKKQLIMGAMPLIKNYYELENEEEIVIEELKHGMIPFKIKRPLPNNTYEVWDVSELTFDHLELNI